MIFKTTLAFSQSRNYSIYFPPEPEFFLCITHTSHAQGPSLTLWVCLAEFSAIFFLDQHVLGWVKANMGWVKANMGWVKANMASVYVLGIYLMQILLIKMCLT